jgi:hypothetical protein
MAGTIILLQDVKSLWARLISVFDGIQPRQKGIFVILSGLVPFLCLLATAWCFIEIGRGRSHDEATPLLKKMWVIEVRKFGQHEWQIIDVAGTEDEAQEKVNQAFSRNGEPVRLRRVRPQ